jgi:hypothetical protein
MIDPFILSCQIKANAIMVKVEGLKASNTKHTDDYGYPEYTQDHFDGYVSDLNEIAENIAAYVQAEGLENETFDIIAGKGNV